MNLILLQSKIVPIGRVLLMMLCHFRRRGAHAFIFKLPAFCSDQPFFSSRATATMMMERREVAAAVGGEGGRMIAGDGAVADGAIDTDGGAGGMTGMGGANKAPGGMMGGMETPIEERCPDGQAGTYLLVVLS